MNYVVGGIIGAVLGGLGAVVTCWLPEAVALIALAAFGVFTIPLALLVLGIPFLIGAAIGAVAGVVAADEL